MKNLFIHIVIALLLIAYSCNHKTTSEKKETILTPEIDMNNLIAWCIVPYDSRKRTPEQRIEMLKELGFKNYAYDWRAEHLPEMAKELKLAGENGINVVAVWMWIDHRDYPGQLSESNEMILRTLQETGLHTQVWTGFSENYIEDLNEEKAIEKGTEMVRYLSERIAETGGKIALYNHGGWLGEPENQVKIIENLPDHEIGIIYNFNHAHEQIDRFPEIVSNMLPYLWVVNLNGMKKEGPMILPIGKGDQEKQMYKTLIEAGFTGPFGILGHVLDADVKVILQQNLEGYAELIM